MKRETRIGLRVVISLILLFWLLRQIDLHEFTQIAQSIRPVWAGITLVILALGVFWSAWKWRILAACQIENPPKYMRWVRVVFYR